MFKTAPVRNQHSKNNLHNEDNVVVLKQAFLPCHREYLMRWLDAGATMGLCDADISPHLPSNDTTAEHAKIIEHVLVWVRENADPAYMIKPEGMHWVVIDYLRNNRLGSYKSFEAALYRIRPIVCDLSCNTHCMASDTPPPY